MENLLDQTAITYPYVTLTPMKGSQIKQILEDVCDNLFNADPYYQQGGDMVRVGGMSYSCDPTATMGHRIGDMSLHGKPIDADKIYKVAGWAPVSEAAQGRRRRADLGSGRAAFAGEKDHCRARTQPSATEECQRQFRHCRLTVPCSSWRRA